MKFIQFLIENSLPQLEAKREALRKDKEKLMAQYASASQSGAAPQIKNRLDQVKNALKSVTDQINAYHKREEAKQGTEEWRKKEQARLKSPEHAAEQEKKKEFSDAVKHGMYYWGILRDEYGDDKGIKKAFIKKAMELTDSGKKTLEVDKLAKAFDVPTRTMYKWLEKPGLESVKKLTPRGTTVTETVVDTDEGSIEEKKLDDMIHAVIKKWNMNPKLFARIKKDVLMDYKESDISKVTQRDILEIIDAGGLEEPVTEGSVEKDSKKVTWKVSSVPTGKWRSFEKRMWPGADYAGEEPAASLDCDDEYTPARAKSGEHGPLTLRIADHSTDPQWKWKKVKKTVATLDEAKKLFNKVLAANPQIAPKQKESTVTESTSKRKFKVGDTCLANEPDNDDPGELCKVIKLLPDDKYKVKEVHGSRIFTADESDMHHEDEAEYRREMRQDR